MQRMGSRVAAIAALVVFVTACGTQQTVTATDPGITSTEIKIGATYPQSGTASFYYSVAKGALAYFAYINAEKGGVNGRKINYVVLDDGYDPAKTPDKARELVQDQKIFAAFGTLGTPNNKAVRDYYNAQKVPQLFVFTGASIWGSEYDKYPYTLGWQPDYVTEAVIYAKYILADSRIKKIAILYQNDAYGQDGRRGLYTALRAPLRHHCLCQRLEAEDLHEPGRCQHRYVADRDQERRQLGSGRRHDLDHLSEGPQQPRVCDRRRNHPVQDDPGKVRPQLPVARQLLRVRHGLRLLRRGRAQEGRPQPDPPEGGRHRRRPDERDRQLPAPARNHSANLQDPPLPHFAAADGPVEG